jgi:uncharacterized protein (TIGR04255 family)
MPFPEVERVIYNKNPLVEVVFQTRFPRFLPIEAELPFEFQKLLVASYPLYEQRNIFHITLAMSSQEGAPPAAEVPGRIHTFLSSDKIWTIALSGDALTVSTVKYVQWEEFRGRAQEALKAFLSVYRLPIFTRLGLRYQDLIRPGELGLAGQSWAKLLKPHIAGEFLDGAIAEGNILARNAIMTAKLSDGDMMVLRHGLVLHKETQTQAYLIDSDFFNDEQRQTDLDGTLTVADRLHLNSGRLFRWCITNALHEAMEPNPVV